MIPVGIFHGEVTRWIVGLIHDWMDNRRADQECSLQYSVRIGGDDMERAGPRLAWGATFSSTGEEYATAVWPI